MSDRCRRAPMLCGLLVVLTSAAASRAAVAGDAGAGGPYGLGRPAGDGEIAALDIAVGPRGAELPPGGGSAAEGAKVYARQCAMCHGPGGHEGPDPALVGGRGTLSSEAPVLTIGSYWRYPTTVFDYVYRAMPFHAPGSLTPDEVYAVTAFLLAENGIIEGDTRLDRDSLPGIVMPNRDGFGPDPRPDIRVDR